MKLGARVVSVKESGEPRSAEMPTLNRLLTGVSALNDDKWSSPGALRSLNFEIQERGSIGYSLDKQ